MKTLLLLISCCISLTANASAYRNLKGYVLKKEAHRVLIKTDLHTVAVNTSQFSYKWVPGKKVDLKVPLAAVTFVKAEPRKGK